MNQREGQKPTVLHAADGRLRDRLFRTSFVVAAAVVETLWVIGTVYLVVRLAV